MPRVADLIPGKKYKRLGYNGQLGLGEYSTTAPVVVDANVNKLYELDFTINGETEKLKCATQYTEFVEIQPQNP